jgi:REP element-mobilizing transposase RayT
MCLFGEVNEDKLMLNEAGKMIAKIFENLPVYYTSISTDLYVVMPNHFHGIIRIERPVGAETRPYG